MLMFCASLFSFQLGSIRFVTLELYTHRGELSTIVENYRQGAQIRTGDFAEFFTFPTIVYEISFHFIPYIANLWKFSIP